MSIGPFSYSLECVTRLPDGGHRLTIDPYTTLDEALIAILDKTLATLRNRTDDCYWESMTLRKQVVSHPREEIPHAG